MEIFARILTFAVAIILLIWAATAIAAFRGVPDAVMAAFLVLACAFALPAVTGKAAHRLPVIGRSFGPLLAMAAITALGIICSLISISVEKRFDPEAASARKGQADKWNEEREAASAKRQSELSAVAQRESASKRQAAATARAEVEQDFNRVWLSVTDALDPCEQAQQSFGEQLRSGAFSAAAYQEAASGRQACFAAYRALQVISPPSGISDESASLTKAGIESCASAAMARMTFFDIASSIIDGDRRPSRLAAAKAQNDAARSATLQCVAQIMGGAGKSGVKISKK